MAQSTTRALLLLATAVLLFTPDTTIAFNSPHSSRPFRSSAVRAPATTGRPRVAITTERRAETRDDSSSSSVGSPSRIPNRALGAPVLFTVPLVWGTYAPVVKYVYEADPPVPGLVFSAAYYSLAAVSLALLTSGVDDSDDSDERLLKRGGLELGSYLFLGNCLQVIGLETVPVDRAAFLVQTTTVLVPAAQALDSGAPVPARTWAACLLAFAGVVVMGTDDGGGALVADDLLANLSFGTGDLLILLAACSYTAHVVRLDRYAAAASPLRLAASKARVEAALSTALAAALFAYGGDGDGGALARISGEVAAYVRNDGAWPPSVPVVLAVLWTGWVTCAYTIFAQSYGQARVRNPTAANLIYSSQPLFSAAFAYYLLGETLGTKGVVGAGLIGSALLLVNEAKNGGGGGD